MVTWQRWKALVKFNTPRDPLSGSCGWLRSEIWSLPWFSIRRFYHGSNPRRNRAISMRRSASWRRGTGQLDPVGPVGPHFSMEIQGGCGRKQGQVRLQISPDLRCMRALMIWGSSQLLHMFMFQTSRVRAQSLEVWSGDQCSKVWFFPCRLCPNCRFDCWILENVTIVSKVFCRFPDIPFYSHYGLIVIPL